MSDSTASAAAPSKIRHEWYQSDNEVVLSIFIKNVKKEDLTVDLSARSISLNIKLPTGSEIAFDLDPLARSIDPTQSSYDVKSMKIEFKLAKASPGIRWVKLEGDEEGTSTSSTMNAAGSSSAPAYPTSSKKKKNWDALAAQVQKEEDNPDPDAQKDPNSGGDKALNEVFQKLYAGATDDQKRAMMKSYQESNGTSLSTNWDDVKKGPVETRPPDSMQAFKWNR